MTAATWPWPEDMLDDKPPTAAASMPWPDALAAGRARAAEHYARKAKLGDQAVNYAHSIKIDAERLLGGFLRETEKNTGTRGQVSAFSGGTKAVPPGDAPTLADLGLSKKLSAESQATTPPCTVCGVVCETCTRHLDRLMRHRDTLLIWLSQGAELHLNASEYYFALGFAYEHIDERAQEVIEFDRHEHFLKRCDELRQASGVELERLINEWGAF